MIGRWWRRSSRLKAKDPSARLRAVQSLTVEEAQAAQSELAVMLREDTAEIRKACLPLMTDTSCLLDCLDDTDLGPAAAETLATRWLGAPDAPPPDHPLVIDACIAASQDQHVPSLMTVITDVERAVALALQASTRTRANVLQHPCLQTETGLVALEKAARGHNKTCFRHAKSCLDQLRQLQTQSRDICERITELDTAIHKELKQQPAEVSALRAHRSKLMALAGKRTTLTASLAETLTRLEPWQADRSGYAVAPDPLADVDLYLPDPASDPFKPLVEQLEILAGQMRACVPLDSISPARDRIADDWLTHADRFPPSAEQHAAFEAVSGQFQRYQAAWQRYNAINWDTPPPEDDGLKDWSREWRKTLKQLNWPGDHQLPQAAQTQLRHLDEAAAKLDSSLAELASRREEFDVLAQAAADAIENGQVKTATQKLIRLRETATTLGNRNALRPDDETTLNNLSAQLGQLKDWHKFATLPKRATLIETLRELAENPQPPLEQADRLRALREEWRQLGRPASQEEFALQKEFDTLAEQAFAPCQAYFEDEKLRRKTNLSAREDICNQVETYLNSTDFATTDLKAAQDILNTARSSWNNHHPCDRKALRPVQERFETLQKQLHGELKKQWDKNVEARKHLLSQARELLERDVTEQVEGAKSLQQQWRNCGPVPRGVDQRLWKEFRGVCDQIFGARDNQRQEERAQADQHTADLQAAIDALVAASAGGCSTAEAHQLKSAADAAAGEVRLTGHLRKALQDAHRAMDNTLAENARAARKDKLEQWRLWDIEVTTAEQAGSMGETPDPVFADRVRQTAAPLDWKRLTLTAEIAADLPSPAADQADRMALQVELMNAGKRRFTSEDRDQLLKDWCAAGPKDATADALRDRFFQALQQ